MATAGGLVFFAGYQDNTFRAYDTQSGEELWLADIAERTPVTLTLKPGARITTTLT